jgi:hypothetical protein
MILHHLGELQPRIRGATDPPTIIPSRAVQVDPLDLLGLDVRRPRWADLNSTAVTRETRG